MKLLRFLILSLVTVLLVVSPHGADAGSFFAFSLREAERRLKAQDRPSKELMGMGGITRIAGIVYDTENSDLVIVGQVNKNEEEIALDDLVVAIRAIVVHEECPYVSIDRTKDTDESGKLTIYFKGGVENTRFGQALLEADIALKRLSLGLLPSEPWGVKSYLLLSVDQLKRKGDETEDRIGSRFWFYPKCVSLALRRGVGAIRESVLGVETRVDYAIIDGKPVDNLMEIRDKVGDQFARQVTGNLEDLSIAYPEIARLKKLLDLTALAKAVQELKPKPALRYWLYDYKVARFETPKDYELIRKTERVKGFDNKVRELLLSGGIELDPMVLRLRAGDVTALRDAVLKSRPPGNALTWHVPLDGWHIPGSSEKCDFDKEGLHRSNRETGFSLDRQAYSHSSQNYRPGNIFHKPLSSPAINVPKINSYPNLIPQRQSSHVGGVMLHGEAKISGSQGEDVHADLTGGGFSLIVEGKRARLAREDFRKFVTSLWAVYYSKEDPGISIDPIAPGVYKHLVRYIGKVINLDLGRVMRDADYLMKKWAVGTEKPDIPGFKNPDDISARRGVLYLGSSRFWFVPEDMRFRRAGNALIFEDGRMTVKTEYVFKKKGMRADPANEAFAKFFSKHYDEIAEKYPVYKELFEYAKMVSLAKYLKEKGVPLFWFLVANKDLVITEDSPGTVDALAKGSDHFRGIQIEGGVDLGFEGNYIYDESALNAISEAISKLPANAYSKTTLSPGENLARSGSESFSFDLEKGSYTVIPQHSLTSGKDRRGIRYQTDLALRYSGQPGLELVRYYDPRRKEGGEFGNGWHLLIPYRIRPADSVRRKFLNAIIPERMAVVNLLAGEREVLTFSTDRYAIAGYVPKKLDSSQVIGLFLMSDASYRLADKLGNEFWFDQAGYLTDMIFSQDHRVHIEYLRNFTNAFEQPAYQVQPTGGERVEFLNARIPNRMIVKDLIHGTSEELTFSDKGMIAGYVPDNAESSWFQILALMSDASFRLLDKRNNEIAFNPGGGFEGLIVSPDRPMVRSISLGKQRVEFKYTINRYGSIMIASARVSGGEDGSEPTYAVHYSYDNEGRLYCVKGSGSQVAEFDDSEGKGVAVARMQIQQ